MKGWSVVVIVALGVAGLLGVLYLTDGQDRSAVITALVGGVGAVLAAVVTRLSTKVDRIEQQTNGTTSRLLDKIPDAQERRNAPPF